MSSPLPDSEAEIKVWHSKAESRKRELQLDGELWLPVVEYEGYYEVSNLGRVRSMEGGKRWATILKPALTSGYLSVRLSRSVGKSLLVHRLVAISFIPNPLNKRTVNHIDGNKLNNKLENLEWATDKENSAHARGMLKLKRIAELQQSSKEGEK